jgi:hypothetical protein
MKELLRTNNVVRLSWAQARLRDAGIESLVLDHHTSLVEGSIGAIPRKGLESSSSGCCWPVTNRTKPRVWRESRRTIGEAATSRISRRI